MRDFHVPLLFQGLVLGIILTLVVVWFPPSYLVTYSTALPLSNVNIDSVEDEVVSLVNDARLQSNLTVLERNEVLDRVALEKSAVLLDSYDGSYSLPEDTFDPFAKDKPRASFGFEERGHEMVLTQRYLALTKDSDPANRIVNDGRFGLFKNYDSRSVLLNKYGDHPWDSIGTGIVCKEENIRLKDTRGRKTNKHQLRTYCAVTVIVGTLEYHKEGRFGHSIYDEPYGFIHLNSPAFNVLEQNVTSTIHFNSSEGLNVMILPNITEYNVYMHSIVGSNSHKAIDEWHNITLLDYELQAHPGSGVAVITDYAGNYIKYNLTIKTKIK